VKLWQYPSYVSSWTQYGPFDISDLISIDGDVYIKFQQYDNYVISWDGILWDDIELEADGTITPVQPSIYEEDFESPLGGEWSTYSSTGYGRNERSTYSANSGSYSWRMDVTSSGNYNLNELILHVQVSDASYLNLRFHTREYYDEQNTLPSSFTGHYNGDGIAVSTNGNNWVRLWQYPSYVSSWTQYGPFDISDLISIDGDVYIKFQQYDNYVISWDGILWDDIELETDGTITT
jgi:hypothetical protein